MLTKCSLLIFVLRLYTCRKCVAEDRLQCKSTVFVVFTKIVGIEQEILKEDGQTAASRQYIRKPVFEGCYYFFHQAKAGKNNIPPLHTMYVVFQ